MGWIGGNKRCLTSAENHRHAHPLTMGGGMVFALLVAFGLASSTAFAALSVTILDEADGYTKTKGLGQLLTDVGQAAKDITDPVISGQAIDLAGCDVFIVGSVCTQNPKLRSALHEAGPKMKAFVDAGGTVIVLTQADQDVARESWVPAPAKITRGDPDFDAVVRVQPKHPIFNNPEAISDAQLKGWRYKNWPTSWESYTGFENVAVLAGNGATDLTMASIIEAGWGKGRTLFLSLAPDKALNIGNDQARKQAPRLMRNLLKYAEDVKAGKATKIEIFKSVNFWNGPITGRVFNDLNGNGKRDEGEPGVANVGVSDRTDLVKTGADGTYTLPNAAGNAEFVYVSLPAGYSKWTPWYHRLKADSPAGSFDFPLIQAEETKSFSFVQVSDIHVGGSGTKDLLAAALADIANLKSPPAFVLATGDLTNVGANTTQYEDYVAGIATSKVPYFSVIGNHDVNDGGSTNYRRYLGPDYYSFDYQDCHFLIVNSMHKTSQQRAWIEKDLELLRGKKRLFIFQHFSPSDEEHKQYAAWSAEGVFSGHWHSQHTVRVGNTVSYNSETLLFGGIDCSPAGFKVIQVQPDRIATRMRFLADGRRLTIVTPAKSLLIPEGDLLVVVNAYQTDADTVSVAYELKSADKVIATGALQAAGDWSWQGAVPAEKIARGAYELNVSATDDKGKVTQAKSSFMVMAMHKPNTAPKGEWTQYGGGPQRGGLAAAPLVPPLGTVWCRHTDGTFDFGSPVLKDGALYLGIKDRGDLDHNGVLSLRADNGEQCWFTPTPAAVSHTVAVDEKRVYACSHGGILHALNRTDGKPVWEQILGSASQRWQYTGPVIGNGLVFAGTYAYFGGFKAEDGAPLWNKSFGADWISSNACPALKGDVVIVAGNVGGKNIRALKADSGETIWEYAAGGLHGSPVITGDCVVFTEYGGLLQCLEFDTGKLKWKHELDGKRSSSTPAVVDGIVITGGTGSIRAFKLDNGDPLWNTPIGTSALKMAPYSNGFAAFAGSPTVANGIAYVPCGDGKLYALAVDSGEVKWSMDFGAPILSAPCIVGNMMYVTAYDGSVYALAARRGFTDAVQ